MKLFAKKTLCSGDTKYGGVDRAKTRSHRGCSRQKQNNHSCKIEKTVKGRRTFLHCSTLTTLTTYIHLHVRTHKNALLPAFCKQHCPRAEGCGGRGTCEVQLLDSWVPALPAGSPGVPREGLGGASRKRPILPRGSRARGRSVARWTEAPRLLTLHSERHNVQ